MLLPLLPIYLKRRTRCLPPVDFLEDNVGNEALCIAANTERDGSIITCDTKSWKQKESKPIKNKSILTFNVSADVKLLAIYLVSWA
ncbi:PREDICTED: SEC12-like protein 2 isoform X2 [Camelina sativa]|uniref:SEC12-like protein 2 isoform X2 n=1 Tax=Camelina sativa TaxID=90675 RepID=A0ABM0T7K5_CAMSA|nr:PREDICTED: SEC12-like protein 2 isoform X2 [Camelina sativa]